MSMPKKLLAKWFLPFPFKSGHQCCAVAQYTDLATGWMTGELRREIFLSSLQRADWLCPLPSNGHRGNSSLLGRKADHSPPYTAKYKYGWSYTSASPYALMAWCLLNNSHNYTFYLGSPILSVLPHKHSDALCFDSVVNISASLSFCYYRSFLSSISIPSLVS
jgi:hypothetical protein